MCFFSKQGLGPRNKDHLTKVVVANKAIELNELSILHCPIGSDIPSFAKQSTAEFPSRSMWCRWVMSNGITYCVRESWNWLFCETWELGMSLLIGECIFDSIPSFSSLALLANRALLLFFCQKIHSFREA